ncbi:MAG TPA: ABC transporter permease [Phycisphaerae bacterium]|nr:ABC transporter permease [Phycisphaerae bacterium]
MVWQAHYTSNLVVAVILAGVTAVAWVLRGDPFARDFFRGFLRRRLAVAATGFFGVFVAVAILDSIAWIDRVNPHQMREARAYQPRSLIDRLFPADFDERVYSAPMARAAFYGDADLKHPGRHLLGTTLIGRDTLHQVLKGFRPAMIIGAFTTLLVVPLAVLTGILAGYFGKWVDDLVQYVYSTLASIPSILLLIAIILVTGRGTFQVCVALGVTTWVGLCRLLRAETLKLRELDYIQAARAQGLGQLRILARHVVPNLLHIVLISSVLRFSGLVLNESILSYFGIGLEGSFGAMIVLARDELAREPVIWWNLAAASIALFLLVLTANIIGDAMRDLLDPRLRSGD